MKNINPKSKHTKPKENTKIKTSKDDNLEFSN